MHFVTKPIELQSLLERVGALLKSSTGFTNAECRRENPDVAETAADGTQRSLAPSS